MPAMTPCLIYCAFHLCPVLEDARLRWQAPCTGWFSEADPCVGHRQQAVSTVIFPAGFVRGVQIHYHLCLDARRFLLN